MLCQKQCSPVLHRVYGGLPSPIPTLGKATRTSARNHQATLSSTRKRSKSSQTLLHHQRVLQIHKRLYRHRPAVQQVRPPSPPPYRSLRMPVIVCPQPFSHADRDRHASFINPHPKHHRSIPHGMQVLCRSRVLWFHAPHNNRIHYAGRHMHHPRHRPSDWPRRTPHLPPRSRQAQSQSCKKPSPRHLQRPALPTPHKPASFAHCFPFQAFAPLRHNDVSVAAFHCDKLSRACNP